MKKSQSKMKIFSLQCTRYAIFSKYGISHFKERVKNKFTLLTRPFVPHLHFKNPYVARLYAVFKAKMRNKISFPRM